MPDMPPRPPASFSDAARFLLGPPPGVREIRVACWVALAAILALVALSITYATRGQPFLGHQPGGDFVAFYVAGKILNEYPAARLYDVPLQYRLQHDLLPEMPADVGVVYANAPFLALPCRAFARLPYLWAYGLWMALSAALYLAGLGLIWPPKRDFGGVSRIALLACFSFAPFAIECWAAGQLSALGFFAIALCTRWQRTGSGFAAGLALAVCLYKPPLLLLIGPMLLIGRRFRVLLGFAVGALGLGALSLAAVGSEGCAGYWRVLRLYAEWTARDPSPLALFKFVDVHSFFRLLLGGHSRAGEGIALILAAGGFTYLAALWARSRPGTKSDRLLWAATVAWTLVFNLYVPIYDTILIVISALTMAGEVYGSGADRAERDRAAFLGWMLVLYVTAPISQALASYARFQILTLVLVAVGWLALRFSRRAETAEPCGAGYWRKA